MNHAVIVTGVSNLLILLTWSSIRSCDMDNQVSDCFFVTVASLLVVLRKRCEEPIRARAHSVVHG